MTINTEHFIMTLKAASAAKYVAFQVRVKRFSVLYMAGVGSDLIF